ncbi:VOC family protein, partial [Oleiphilus sp. HI0125]
MQFLHTMIRVSDVEASLKFFCDGLGLIETRRYESEAGRFTLIYLAAPDDEERAHADKAPELEL